MNDQPEDASKKDLVDEPEVTTSEGQPEEGSSEDSGTPNTVDGEATNEPEQNKVLELESEHSPEIAEDAMPSETEEPKEVEDAKTTAYPRKWLIWALAAVLVVTLGVSLYMYFKMTAPESTTSSSTTSQVAKMGAAITYAQGTVEYARSGDWQAADGDLELSEGDKIRTGDESRVVVTFDDGSAIRLDAQSEVTILSLAVTNIAVENTRGNVYSRVTASDSRAFDVEVSDTTYTALGTAFMTTKSDTVEGVEVYQSKVSVGETTVNEGQSYFVKNPDEAKQTKLAQIDLEGLKSNTFLKWNKAEDAKDVNFADKLGVLKDIDTPVATPAPAVTTTPTTTQEATAGIVLKGEKTSDGIQLSWTVTGLNTKNGFKVAYSKTTTTPSYGTDSAKFVDGTARSVKLALKDGKTWHIRICRYDGDGKCSYYSNSVSVTAPYEEVAKVTTGSTTVALNEATLSWTFTGTAPYGFKVVWNTSGAPTYPTSGSNAGAQYMPSGGSLNLGDAISSPGTYKVRACKYTNGTEASACVDYSNEITYVKS